MIALDPNQTIDVPFAGETFRVRFLTARETIRMRELFARATANVDENGIAAAVELLRLFVVDRPVDVLPDQLTFSELYGLIVACDKATTLAEADRKKSESPSPAPAAVVASDAPSAAA